MRFARINICLSALVVLTMTLMATASPMDMHRAISGADRPFTTLKDNLPTEWSLWLEPRITGPTTSNRGWHFPERGYGNTFNAIQSQLLELGTRRRLVEGDRTGIWIIWDMLAWVPVPHLLYLETMDAIGPWTSPWFNAPIIKPKVANIIIPHGYNPVPEPTSGALILIGCVLLMSRTTRRRSVRI